MKIVNCLLLIFGVGALCMAIKALLFKSKQIKEQENRVYDFDEENLFIENQAGSINIESWEDNKIEIIATKKAHKDKINHIKVNYKFIGNKFSIKTSGLEHDSMVDLDIKVPRKISLVNINANAGAIKIADIDGRIDVNSNAGLINIIDAVSSVKAHVNAGAVKLTQKSLSFGNTIDINTNAGAIKVKLPQDINAQITANSSLGTIKSHFSNLCIKRKFPYISANAHATLGSGDANIKLNTNTGSISIKKY